MNTKRYLLLAAFIISGILLISQAAFAALEGSGSGLVGCWKFDEGSGTTAADSSGNGNTATLRGSAGWAAGRVGQALQVNGVANSYVSLTANPITNFSNPSTVCAWAYSQNLGTKVNSTNQHIINLYADGSNSMRISVSPGGNVYVGYYAAGATRGLQSNGSLFANNTWCHVCTVYNGSSLALYANGQQVTSMSPSSEAGNAGNFIGAYASDTGNWYGALDEVRVYNRALTAQEINDLYTYTGGSPDTQAPSVPSNLHSTTVSALSATLAWDASTDNVAVAGYTIYRNGNPVGTSTTTTYTDTGLTPLTSYAYTVAAFDAAGNTSAQSASAVVNTTALPALTISAVSANAYATSATITWSTNLPANSQVDYGTTSAYGSYTSLDTALTSAHSQTLSGLTPATTYHFMVSSNDGRGMVTSGDYTFTTAAQSAGNTYYVSTIGNDTTNDGTQAHPWRTVQHAADSVSAGDTVSIRDGLYSSPISITRSGTQGNPITYTGTTNAWIANKITVNANYIIIDGIRIGNNLDTTDNNNAASYPAIVFTGSASNNIVRNCLVDNGATVDGPYGNAIRFEGTNTYNTIANNTFRHQNWAKGIVFFGNSSSYNTATGNTISNTWDCDDFYIFGLYQTVSNNDASGNLIVNPILRGAEQHADVIQTYGENGTTSLYNTVENNYFHDTQQQAGFLTKDGSSVGSWTIRNNIFANISSYLRPGIPDTKIYNNLFYNVGSSYTLEVGGATPAYDSTNLEIINNAFIGNQAPWIQNTSGTQPYTHSYNYYGNANFSAKNFSLASGETGKIEGGDPKFVDPSAGDFHLQATSPAINAGANLSQYFITDKDGHPRPATGPWTISAYEYVPLVRYGDVSGDGTVSAYDAALAAQAAVGLITLTDTQKKAADVSGDGVVTAYDAALIAERVVGLISSFPVGG